MLIAVQDGQVMQCPRCWRLMDDGGQVSIRAEGLITSGIHLPCPACTMKIVAGEAQKPERN